MNARRRFAIGFCAAGAFVVACTSVERSAPDASGGSGGDSTGGTSVGGVSSSSGTGATGEVGAGRKEPAAGGASGSASAGTSAGGTPGSAGSMTATGMAGMAGMGVGQAGEAGGPSHDAQPLLMNGSFELGLAGWQFVVAPDTVGKSVYTQWANTSGVSIDGAYELSYWNGTYAFTGDIHQTVTGLTPGKYQLKLYIAYGTGINAAYLYAINCGPTDAHVDLPLAPGVASFTATSIPSIDVTGDSCTIGLFADMNIGDWLNADAFVFEPLPAN